jgi:hypothetical protein
MICRMRQINWSIFYMAVCMQVHPFKNSSSESLSYFGSRLDALRSVACTQQMQEAM